MSSVAQPPAEDFAQWMKFKALADTEQVVFDGPVVIVSAGGRHSVSVTADVLYSWGDGSRGHLGHGKAAAVAVGQENVWRDCRRYCRRYLKASGGQRPPHADIVRKNLREAYFCMGRAFLRLGRLVIGYVPNRLAPALGGDEVFQGSRVLTLEELTRWQ